jgi:hypothetical protein
MGCLTREILAGFASVFQQETIGFQGESGAQPGKRSAPLRGECLNADWLETCPRPGRGPLFSQLSATQRPDIHQTAHFYRS